MPIFDTGFLSPSANGTPATYDGSATEFTDPANAYSSNDTYATVVDNEATYKYQSYGNFGISLDSSYIIKGIEVAVEGKISAGVSSEMAVVLEDADSNYTVVTPGFFVTTEATYTYGGSTTLPSGTWTAAGLADANFHVIARTGSSNDGRTISLDHIKVKVYYDTGPNLSESVTIAENIDVRIFYSSDIDKADTTTITESVTVNMETLSVSVTDVVSIASLVYDANDGITYDTGGLFDEVSVVENVGTQSIRYSHGGRVKGTTERHGL